MTERRIVWIVSILFLIVGAGTGSSAVYLTYQPQLQQLSGNVANLQTTLTSVQSQITSIQSQLSQANSQLSQTQTQLTQVRS